MFYCHILTLTPSQTVLWLLGGLFFLFAEMLIPGLFFFISFAGGAAIASFAAWMELTFEAQVIAWLAGSYFSFICLRKMLNKRRLSSVESKESSSNTFALVGTVVKVVDPIPHGGTGRVKASGELWSAIMSDRSSLDKGLVGQVVKIEGNKLVLKQIISSSK